MEFDKIQSFISLTVPNLSIESTNAVQVAVENEPVRVKIMKEINRELQISRVPPKVDMRRLSEISDITIDDVMSVGESESLITPEAEDVLLGLTPLSTYNVVTITCILEEALEALQLLGAIHPVSNLRTTIRYKPLSERYMLKAQMGSGRAIEAEIYKDSADFTHLTYYRLQETRLFVQLIFKEASKDILVNASFNSLVKRINSYIQLRIDDEDLFKELAYNRLIIPKLNELLKKEESKFNEDIQRCSEHIGNLKDSIEDEIYLSRLKEDYVVKWENSRNEQNRILNDKLEKIEMNTINTYHTKLCDEFRVHHEILRYLDTNMDEMEFDITKWQNMYQDELEKKEMQLQIITAERDKVIEAMDALEKQYQNRKKQIEDYLEYKEERKRQQLILDEKNKCASKIQSWWRMLMVRKGLGPYRKKKPKGKKKDAKAKK